MAVSPARFPTVDGLRDALVAGQVSVFKAVVVAVRVGGSVQPDAPVRAKADDVTYDVRVVDSGEVFHPDELSGMTPHNRRSISPAVWACQVDDLVDLVRFGPDTRKGRRLHLYTRTEHEAFVGCQGEWVD